MRTAVFALLFIALGAIAPLACSSESSAPAVVTADAGDERGKKAPPPTDDAGPVTGPGLLSETGLYSDIASKTLASDLIAFKPRYELWSDGADKARYLYLPPGTKIDTSSIDHFTFPLGTKAFKEFRYGGKLVETRLMMKVREGTGNDSWWQAAYVWKEDGSDAVARIDGVENALGTGHNVPKQTDCLNCHGDVSDVLIGVSAIQLADPASNTLAEFASRGLLTDAPPSGIDVPGTGDVKEALAYLHANCGHCHNAEATRLAAQSKMRLRLLVSDKTPEVTSAYTTTVGTVMKHILPGDVTEVIVKGDPDKSGLYVRMGLRDNFGMPPVGTQVVDTTGRETIRKWIAGWQ